jgi:hypothetical protein
MEQPLESALGLSGKAQTCLRSNFVAVANRSIGRIKGGTWRAVANS